MKRIIGIIFALCLPVLAVNTQNGSRSFNGTSDFITVTNQAAFDITGQQITISAWVYFASVPASTEMEPMSKADTGATQYEIYINAGGQPAKTLGIYVRQSTSLAHDVFMNCSTQASVGWNQIVATWSSVRTTWFVYCGGTQANTSTTGAGATIQSNGDNLLIGKKAASSPTFCTCQVAQLAIWNVALSQGQAAALGHVCPIGGSARRAGFPQPVAYWPLTGLASPEPDLSGNVNRGVLTGTSSANGPPCTP